MFMTKSASAADIKIAARMIEVTEGLPATAQSVVMESATRIAKGKGRTTDYEFAANLFRVLR